MKTTFLDRWFHISARGSSVYREVLGGTTTFATMAYIIVVNPAILSFAQVPIEPSTIATILATVFGCLLMGLYANRPFAVAPYMGENVFIAFGLIGISWQQRLGTVFIAGLVFFVLTLCRARTWVTSAISPNLKCSFAIGIGLFLLLVGLYETDIIASSVRGLPMTALPVEAKTNVLGAPPTPLKIGDFGDLKVQLALAGFLLMAVLTYWNIRGAILLGIVVIGTAGYFLGVGEAPRGIVAWPTDYHVEEIAFQLDIPGVLRFDFLTILLTLFLISFLDTIASIYALGTAAGMLDEKGNLADIERPMFVDSLSCIFSALIGTSTSGAFIESATGIREGARTGLAAVVTGLLFALVLFFVPLVQPLQKLQFAYGPALMIVGVIMFGAVKDLDTQDLTELVPALVTIVMMVFTYNIANGLTAGLILHPVMKVLCGRWRQIHPASAVLGVLCLLYYFSGHVH